jgi:hypothetical protein
MGHRAVFAMRRKAVWQFWVPEVRRSAAFTAGLGLVLWSLAGGPTAAQVRPDPIDRSRGLSTKPMPTLAAPEQPPERVVPESRQRDLGTGKVFVVPPHYERSTTDRQWQAPPPTRYGTPPGESPRRIPGR